MCLEQQTIDRERVNQDNKLQPYHSRKSGLHIGGFRRPTTAQYNAPKKKISSSSLTDEGGLVKNISALPITGTFDHTNRPGTIQWKTPKLTLEQPKSSKDVILGPVYRLPLDSDDTGSQVRMEWAYANLKVRPEKLTIEAVGPNKATWTVSVIEGKQTTATWDLKETPSYSPLIEGFYTLHIHDQRGQDTLPKPGWLLPDAKMKIALYKTEGNHHVGEIIALSECATCYKHVM